MNVIRNDVARCSYSSITVITAHAWSIFYFRLSPNRIWYKWRQGSSYVGQRRRFPLAECIRKGWVGCYISQVGQYRIMVAIDHWKKVACSLSIGTEDNNGLVSKCHAFWSRRRKFELLRHRAVSLREHGFLVFLSIFRCMVFSYTFSDVMLLMMMMMMMMIFRYCFRYKTVP